MLTREQLRKSMEPDEDAKREIEDKILEAAGRGFDSIQVACSTARLGWLDSLGYRVSSVGINYSIVYW